MKIVRKSIDFYIKVLYHSFYGKARQGKARQGVGILLFIAIVSISWASSPLQPLTISKTDFVSNIISTDRDLYPASFPAVEQDISVPHSHDHIVHRRSDTITVNITIYNPNPIVISGTFHITEPSFGEDSGQSHDLGVFTQGVVVPAGGETTVTYTLSGMPAYVTKGWFYAAAWIGDGILDSYLYFRIYRTESTPNTLQTVPWHDVLEDACDWANGVTGQDTVAYEVKNKFGFSNFLIYDGSPSKYFVQTEGWNGNYRLKKFFVDRGTPPYYIKGDCRDVSGYLELAMSAIGISNHNLTVVRPLQNGQYYPLMITNPICPIGTWPGDIANYNPTEWNFHQIVERSSNTFDSCASLALDLSGGAYKKPPAGSGWPTSGWWQTVNSTWPGPGNPYAFFGLVTGVHLWDISSEPEVDMGIFNPVSVTKQLISASIQNLLTN